MRYSGALLRTAYRFPDECFPGSRRLFEVADSITEIKTICRCGRKATVNARIGEDGQIVTSGSQVLLGGNDRYEAMCHRCWKERIARESAENKKIWGCRIQRRPKKI